MSDAPLDMTLERPLEGLSVAQPRRGFRYGSEAFWLVGFALEGGRPQTAVDLGTGSGIMACLLARAGATTIGVELRPEWQAYWAVTLAQSSGLGPVTLTQGEVSSLKLGATADLVVSNPPFFPHGSGPVSPNAWKAAARTESRASLADFVSCAMRSTHKEGRVCFVVPRERASEVGHARAHVSRRVDVGQRRTLIELRHGSAADASAEQVQEDSPRVAQWYALACVGAQ